MMTHYWLAGGGLALLFLGGEMLVRGSVGLARRLGVSPLLIGLVVVGFGTSTPELIVSLGAALQGRTDIAVGNVVGSNIANILLILGIAALIYPIHCPTQVVYRDGLAMLAASLVIGGVWSDKADCCLAGRSDGGGPGCFHCLFLLDREIPDGSVGHPSSA